MRSSDPNCRLRVLGWALHGLGVLIVLAMALFAELVGYRPLDAQVAASANRTGKLESLLREEGQYRSEHARLKKDLEAARRQAAVLNKKIPNEPREADFLAQISGLADEVGLEIQDYRPGPVTPRPSYSTMRVDLLGRGDYGSICVFLNGLSGLPRHCSVVRLEIDSPGQDGRYLVRISLELYIAADNPSPSEKE